ncbi:odorant receptor 13a-like [Odontomachus brunneus]|uniref:odorant receptor 13a-like n=1 Tax=Odontomachus brunneus TaxID=486640 RepID=UPI0013F22937|nr:odorant receptor 13a-like [Odontomachus brunneus]
MLYDSLQKPIHIGIQTRSRDTSTSLCFSDSVCRSRVLVRCTRSVRQTAREASVMMRRNTLNRTLKYLFILYGIWPGIPCVLICRVFWVVTILFIEYSIFRYLLAHVYTAELLDLVDGLCSFLAYGKVLTKFIVFWLKQRKFIEIMSMMSDDWDESAKSDVALRETQHKAKLSDRVMNSVFVLHTITIIGYSFGIIINDIDVTNHTSELPYVEKVDIPFEVNTQLTYRSILIAEFLFVIMCAWAAGVTNALLMCLTLHAAGQIDILRKCLTQIVPRANENKDQSIDVVLNQVIQKHQRIIIFSKNVENLYTQIAFLQFASNMIMICSLGFLIVKAVGSPDAVKQIIRSLLFYTITNLEAFIFCFAGEYLSNKSKLISLAAYNSEWYNLKPRNARVLLFVILRSQKQLILTAGKMMDLSLESFASIMNASGSYLSVLLAMQ